jgi:hypothetical protein
MSDEGKKPGKSGGAVGGGRRRPGDNRPFVPFERFEDVKARCGHIVQFGLLPDGKDRFREGRRNKATSRDCKACREKKQQEQLEVAQRKQAEKEQRKLQEGTRPTRPDKTRLPDGSRFEVQYDAANAQWTGTLSVPTAGAKPASFTGSRSSLFKLLAILDDQYRATLQ